MFFFFLASWGWKGCDFLLNLRGLWFEMMRVLISFVIFIQLLVGHTLFRIGGKGFSSIALKRMCFPLVFSSRFILGIGGRIGNLFDFSLGMFILL